MSPFLLFSAIGVVALGIGAWKTVEANPHRRIPLICPPRDRPLPIILLQAVGYGSSILRFSCSATSGVLMPTFSSSSWRCRKWCCSAFTTIS